MDAAPQHPERVPVSVSDHFLVEIFMIPPDQDHGVLLQKGEDEALHLHGFLPAVEDIPQDDQLVRLWIVEIPRFIQRLMKFRIKAVNIGGDIVFHDRMLSCLCVHYLWAS